MSGLRSVGPGRLPGWLLGSIGLVAVLAVYFAVPVIPTDLPPLPRTAS